MLLIRFQYLFPKNDNFLNWFFKRFDNSRNRCFFFEIIALPDQPNNACQLFLSHIHLLPREVLDYSNDKRHHIFHNGLHFVSTELCKNHSIGGFKKHVNGDSSHGNKINREWMDVVWWLLLWKVAIITRRTCIPAAKKFVIVVIDWIWKAKTPHAVSCRWIH